MPIKSKPSISSRTSVRALIVACLPAAALGLITNSRALGAAFTPIADQGPASDDNTNAASTISPSTNSGFTGTNHFEVIAGQRG